MLLYLTYREEKAGVERTFLLHRMEEDQKIYSKF